MRCSRCHAPARYTARRHRLTLHLCLPHHQAVWRSLVQDGWIVSPVKARRRAAA